jgi:hypothetical protein
MLVGESAPLGTVEATHVWLLHHAWVLQHVRVLHQVVGSMSHRLLVVLLDLRDVLHLMLMLPILAILDLLLVVVRLLAMLIMLQHTTSGISHHLMSTTKPVDRVNSAATDKLRVSPLGEEHDIVFSILTCHLCHLRSSLLWQNGLVTTNHRDNNVKD